MVRSDSITDSILLLVSFSTFLFSCAFVYVTPPYKRKYVISLDYPSKRESRKGSVLLGKVMYEDKTKHKFFLSIKDLERHMLITGKTGSGKSNFFQHFLINFTKKYDIPFFLAEFKGEYHYLQDNIKDLLVLKPGINFSLNIFDPEGSHPQIHAERVFQIFKSGGLFQNVDYSPQMERVFIAILNEVCSDPKKRCWEEFHRICKDKLIEDIDVVGSLDNTVDAVINRIRRYSIGTLRHIFVSQNVNFKVKSLFDHKVLLDLSSIMRLGGEKDDALFFLNMILKYLWDQNMERGSRDYKGIRHITIIEDGQYFAPSHLSESTKLTSYIEDIALLLRGTGECLITIATRPDVSKEILANAGIRISFTLDIQQETMQELLNLKEYQKNYLSELEIGQCVVKVNSIEKPFLLRVPNFVRKWLSDEVINERNKNILGRELQFQKSFNERKKSYCEHCGKVINSNKRYCDTCRIDIEYEEYVKTRREKEENKRKKEKYKL